MCLAKKNCFKVQFINKQFGNTYIDFTGELLNLLVSVKFITNKIHFLFKRHINKKK